MKQPGDTLGHYRLLAPLGGGGEGVVWRALDTRLGREVGLKLLPEAVTGDERALARLESEAHVVAQLNHPNIVTLYSVEEAAGTRFLTMELVEGCTLASLIPEQGFAFERLLDLAIPLTEAIAAAHERGITHRDLKPQNVMVTPDGRVKVLDFGLASVREPPVELSDANTRSWPAGQIVGTLAYMSPEQVQGQDADARSDIFSLGIMLYEMATGRRPFQGDTASALIAAILRDVPPPATGANVSPALSRLIARCLEKDPRRRIQSALDLRSDLEDARRGGAADVAEFGPSIAVLPPVDMSQGSDQGFFCEGMAEEIITALAKIEGLRVASRTASFAYKDAALDPREIGRRLQVATLLEGSVRKAGDHLRISAQLIDVGTGFHLWAEKYDRELRDVFALQDEIADNIARALGSRLGTLGPLAPRKAPTADLDAYEFYLRGRSYYFQYNRRGMRFALEMYGHAVELDPRYARAHAGIANCCAFLYIYVDRQAASRERAEAASQRAIELDPALAEAHASRGVALSAVGRNQDAEQAFEEALRLDPQLFEASYFYARHAFARGELEKAARLYERASAVRPEDYQALLLLPEVYRGLGRQADADAARRRGLAIAEEHLRSHPEDVRARYMGANALVALGEREKGLEWARSARALDPDDPMLLYNIGCIHALAGDAREAIECLERSVAAGLTEKGWFLNDTDLDGLRGEARFQALVERLT